MAPSKQHSNMCFPHSRKGISLPRAHCCPVSLVPFTCHMPVIPVASTFPHPISLWTHHILASALCITLKVPSPESLPCQNRKASVLSLFDLSAAFDTNDHSLLPDAFQTLVSRILFSVGSLPTSLIAPINISAFAFSLSAGVPQGSVLGSLLLFLCSVPGEPHQIPWHSFLIICWLK